MIVDKLHHEDIWKEWLKDDISNDSTDSTFTKPSSKLFIHAKNPEKITSPWVKEHLINHTFKPTWNSVEVIQAILSTIENALQYKNNKKESCGRFIFGTESCIPLRSLRDTVEIVYKEDCSWLAAYHTPNDKYDSAASFHAVDAKIVPTKVSFGYLYYTLLYSVLYKRCTYTYILYEILCYILYIMQ